MPNHVRNVWTIKGIKTEKEKNYLLNKLTTVCKSHDEGAREMNTRIIDFDLIIPEPRFIKDCPKDCLINKESHVREVEDRPWFDWYRWHLKYWGTKWGAYDGYTIIKKTQITFVFNTAWSFAVSIADKLTKLGYDLELRYADEDLGSNCGKITYTASEDTWKEVIDGEIPNPRRFGEYLWDNY